jgi:hypothetical protein
MIRWPDQIIISFWTFTIQYAFQIHNATPLPCGLTPEEIFTRQKGRRKLDTFHTFGCPTFVLNETLQNGKKIPKWQPRSRQAIFVGISKNHAQSVPCVYNPRSRLASPQFHVVFDDTFGSTTCAATNALPVKLRPLPLPQPQLRARTYAETNPSAQRATQLRSVLARVYSVSRQNLNTTTVP